ncbi:MAG: type II toxin-antitoxin system RelE/ParE family toxin [Nitrospirota bacterium]|nr:type II toxin-antitoxin system RelE/ParE family toxin [Nitrospirota bacterium]
MSTRSTPAWNSASARLSFATNPILSNMRAPQTIGQSELGSYRFRIGDYRVVFDIEGDEIVVLRVGHRRDIYRR